VPFEGSSELLAGAAATSAAFPASIFFFVKRKKIAVLMPSAATMIKMGTRLFPAM
jgi:hypothetical protein